VRGIVFLNLWVVMLVAFATAQSPASRGKMLLVTPFENVSGTPGLQWIGDAFPEILGQRMSSRALYVIGRDDRLRAFDQLGLPVTLRPSRATLYRVAEQMGVDYLVFGYYSFDGRILTAKAQLLDMEKMRLSPEITESGPLIELIDLQTALAWDLVRIVRPDFPVSHDAFKAAAPPIRLDAFDSQQRQPLGAQDRQQRLDLRAQVVRHRLAVSLVFGKQIVPERLAGGVEDHGDPLRLIVLDELQEHVQNAVNRTGRLAT